MKGAKFLASKFRRCKFFDKSHVCLSTRWPRLILRWGVEDLHWGPTVIKVVMVLSSCHLQRILQMMQPMKHWHQHPNYILHCWYCYPIRKHQRSWGQPLPWLTPFSIWQRVWETGWNCISLLPFKTEFLHMYVNLMEGVYPFWRIIPYYEMRNGRMTGCK